MKNIIFKIYVGLFFVIFAQTAQAQLPPGCNFSSNPHSFACTDWTFSGTSMFPLQDLSWPRVSGFWTPITYVNPWSENIGPEFAMLVENDRPTVPVTVINRFDGTDLGPLLIKPQAPVFYNWLGSNLNSVSNIAEISDSQTLRLTFVAMGAFQGLTCRIFQRHKTDHLLCAWFVMPYGYGYWQFHGYLGFLKD